jgi:hypothetical protein
VPSARTYLHQGSKNTLQQAKRHQPQQSPYASVIDDGVVVGTIMSSCSCVPQCIPALFSNQKGVVDFNAAIEFVRKSRKHYIDLDKDDQDNFILNKFKESIVNLNE